MRLTQKKIEEILIKILGEDGMPIVKELAGKENVSEFDLATKTKKDIKVVRKMLYLLYNNNLVGFTRKKDKQKGWYIYYWTLIAENIKFSYFKSQRELLEKLRDRLENEEKELFFICSSNCVRLNFDESIGFDFHCPECGELISQDSGESRIIHMRKRIEEIEKELKVHEKEKKKVLKKQAKVRKKVVKAKTKLTKIKKTPKGGKKSKKVTKKNTQKIKVSPTKKKKVLKNKKG
jgi:transcription initiation factor TFIIE subunit alpha